MSSRSFTAEDAWSLNGGTHVSLHDVLGAHPNGNGATTFRVWAPDAAGVAVIGDLNDWAPGDDHRLAPDPSGVWRGTMPGVVGQRYKFRITPKAGDPFDKADPFAFACEKPPATASIIVDRLDHAWADDAWMRTRKERISLDAPVSVYEVHLGSWRYEPGGYRAIAEQLADYAVETGFTHVEMLPITEHPFYGSWGYQTTGYFAPTSRYGSPDDFAAFVDTLHQHDLGVILDWVPSHFPGDAYGLATFDGTHLFEHPDPRLGHHPDWDSCIFNYERNEVRSFLLSSAHFWIERFHIDALRVDAVASMLYRDYSRAEGEWLPNERGGNENDPAVAFLQELNRSLYLHHPDIQVIAEESTAWPGVTTPVDQGGLGFGYKWDMGWMHDTLQFIERDTIHRGHHSRELTFRNDYRQSEKYLLPLSHDEVVHGKGSLLSRMPGDPWQRFANVRLLLAMQWTTPGKKLLFMGGEFAVPGEWNHEAELDWALLGDDAHAGVQRLVTDLNDLYRSVTGLHAGDHTDDGFTWIVGDDTANAVFAFVRSAAGDAPAVVVANTTPVPRDGYRIGVPSAGTWRPRLETDDFRYGGSGIVNADCLTEDEPAHGQPFSIIVTAAPLAVTVFVHDGSTDRPSTDNQKAL